MNGMSSQELFFAIAWSKPNHEGGRVLLLYLIMIKV